MSRERNARSKARRPNPGELALLRVRVEKRCSTVAQAVLDYIDLAQGREPPRFRRSGVPPKLQGRLKPNDKWKHVHGKKRAELRAKARQQSFWQPDETEKQLQEINRLMRDHMRNHPGDGLIAGPLAVAATYAISEFMQDAYDLPGPEHSAALYTYLVDSLGMVLHQFDREAYLRWREACRQRASTYLHDDPTAGVNRPSGV